MFNVDYDYVLFSLLVVLSFPAAVMVKIILTFCVLLESRLK